MARLFMHRLGLGELDPSTGELFTVGSTLIDELFTFGAGIGSVTFRWGFTPTARW